MLEQALIQNEVIETWDSFLDSSSDASAFPLHNWDQDTTCSVLQRGVWSNEEQIALVYFGLD